MPRPTTAWKKIRSWKPKCGRSYARWDQRDPEVVALWEETRQWSLDGFNEMYDLLDIRFDTLLLQQHGRTPGKEMVDELIESGIATDERPDGPVIVKLDELLGLTKEKYRVLVVLRSDGTALYATEDLALAKTQIYRLPRPGQIAITWWMCASRCTSSRCSKPWKWPGTHWATAASTFLTSWSTCRGMW